MTDSTPPNDVAHRLKTLRKQIAIGRGELDRREGVDGEAAFEAIRRKSTARRQEQGQNVEPPTKSVARSFQTVLESIKKHRRA